MLSSLHKWGYRQQGFTLPVLVGVMLFLHAIRIPAQTTDSTAVVVENNTSSRFAWFAHTELDANYLWRGLYCGGLSFQAEAEVSYYGFFLNTWWNVGTTNWKWGKRDSQGKLLTGLNAEADVALGYKWRGLTLQFIEMYYFDHYADGRMSRFFDWRNYAPGGGGVTTEWRVAYRISDRVPLRLMWCTRTFGRDGYISDGELKRAFSTYIEARYDQPLPQDVVLSGVIGVTPWKSLYTGFEKNFAVVNLSVEACKSWQVADRCYLDLGGQVAFNPHAVMPLWNIHFGVTWK